MQNIRLYIFLVIFLSNGAILYAQDYKQEVEIQIKDSQVPERALDFFEDEVLDWKWYKEMNYGFRSYEAKFIKKDLSYSVEFDSLGLILDIEVLINVSDIPQNVLQNLQEELKDKSDVKILKAQKQYQGAYQLLKNWFHSDTDIYSGEINYEIECSTKDNNGYEDLEFLFSNKGTLIARKKMIGRSMLNVEF